MDAPNITWYVKEYDDSYSAYTEYFAGSCTPGKDFIIDLEVWNNRWNIQSDVKDITNGKLEITFSNAEDSILLTICEVKINDGLYNKISVSEFNRGLVSIGTLSGKTNEGTYDNTENYKKISLKFKNVPNNFKDGFKSMILNVVY